MAGEPCGRGGRGGSSATAGWLAGLSGSATSSQTTPPCCYQVTPETVPDARDATDQRATAERCLCLCISLLLSLTRSVSTLFCRGGHAPLDPPTVGAFWGLTYRDAGTTMPPSSRGVSLPFRYIPAFWHSLPLSASFGQFLLLEAPTDPSNDAVSSLTMLSNAFSWVGWDDYPRTGGQALRNDSVPV